MKKLITIFLLCVLCIQCLPVREMGKCLFNSDFTEEETCKKGIEKNETAEYTQFLNLIHTDLPICTNDNTFNFHSEIIPGPVADITSPPPDYI